MPRITIFIFLLFTLAACAPTETRTSSDEAELNARYALQFLRQGKPEPAREKIEIAMQLDPQMAGAKSIAALIYQSIGQPARAEKFYEEALKLAPSDPATLNNYGKYLCSRGRLRDAENKFLTAVESPNNPNPEVAYANAGLCAKRIPDTDLASQYFRAALDINPDMPLALYQLAEINHGKKRYSLAREELQRFQLASDPTPETLWLGIRNERALNNQEEVTRLTNILSEQFPDSEEARQMVAGKEELITPSTERQTTPVANQPTSEPVETSIAADVPRVRDQRWLLDQPPSNYTIHLIKSQQKDQLFGYLKSNQLKEDVVYLSYREGQDTWYSLLYGSYIDQSMARNSMNQLPVQLTENSPTLATFGDFQQLLNATY